MARREKERRVNTLNKSTQVDAHGNTYQPPIGKGKQWVTPLHRSLLGFVEERISSVSGTKRDLAEFLNSGHNRRYPSEIVELSMRISHIIFDNQASAIVQSEVLENIRMTLSAPDFLARMRTLDSNVAENVILDTIRVILMKHAEQGTLYIPSNGRRQ